MSDLAAMMARHAQAGRVVWIGLRPERRAEMIEVAGARIGADGLAGDHGRPGKRAVTLIQAEHLSVIGALLGRGPVAPELVRRNVVVAGLNLLALRHRDVALGGAVLHVEGPCPPCSRMEEAFGSGGYSAVRGHGGVYASVVSAGRVALGDAVAPAGAARDVTQGSRDPMG